MFWPIISIGRGPGIKFLDGLGLDVPAYNFFRCGPGIKLTFWPEDIFSHLLSLKA